MWTGAERLASAEATALHQVEHCGKHHSPPCRLETCNLARCWLRLYRDRVLLHNMTLEQAAQFLRKEGANQKWVELVRSLKKMPQICPANQ
jgi:hypothetical protein